MTEASSVFDKFLAENQASLPFRYVDFKQLSAPKARPQGDFYISRYAAKLICATLQHSGMEYKESPEGVSLIVGSTMPEEAVNELVKGQRYNHYTRTFSLGSKEGFHFLMQELSKKLGDQPEFYPESYVLPRERAALQKNFENSDLWISKPAGGARGQGIKIVREIPRVAPGHRVVCQKYVKNPLLINGLKFDLRFYVAVTSLDPLRIYLYENGLVRLATQPYEENINETDLLTAHLTNFCINRDQENFKKTDDASHDGEGSKWSHRAFWRWLDEQDGWDSSVIKKKIEDAIATVIIAAHKTFKEQRNSRIAFEMFGFDVMLDTDQNVWILEANVTPALGTSSGLDMDIKGPLVADYFNVALVPKKMEDGAKIDGIMMEDVNPNQRVQEFVSVVEYEMAEKRRGGFRCIYPTVDRCTTIGEYMEDKSKNDIMLADWIAMTNEEKEEFLNDSLKAFGACK